MVQSNTQSGTRRFVAICGNCLPGKWRKVIKKGNIGETHYFEHDSGQVAGVKFIPGKTA